MFGFRWLQRIRLPFGFRSTLSRGGVGYSWGVPGFRVGISPSGRKWISFGFPGLGLSFFRYIGKSQNNRDAIIVDSDELLEIPPSAPANSQNPAQERALNSRQTKTSKTKNKLKKWKNLK